MAVPAQAAPVEVPAPVLVAPAATMPVLMAAQAVEPAAVTGLGEAAPSPVALVGSAGPVALAATAWTNLGLNRPGQAAREQAIAHKQAAPVKTLLARVLRVHTDERAWRIGRTARRLSQPASLN